MCGKRGRLYVSKKLNSQDLDDLIKGAVVLASGGGGKPESGREMFSNALTAGKSFELLEETDIRADQFFALVSYVGGGVSKEEQEMVKGLPVVYEYPLVQAAGELESYLGKSFDGFFPSEIGAGNTPAAMHVAAMKGKPTLDADTVGARSKPELSISTTHVAGMPISPLASVNNYGEVAIIKQAVDDQRMEVLARYLARSSGGRCGTARCPCNAKQAKTGLIWGTISLTVQVGGILRTVKENVLDALMKSLDGSLRFVGKVQDFEHERRAAFNWGNIRLKGTDRFADQRYKVWYKNENLVSWRDGTVDVTCPDSILIVDARSGEGLLNEEEYFTQGREVAVIGRRCPEIWTRQKGLEIFGPGHFGFDFPYQPFQV